MVAAAIAAAYLFLVLRASELKCYAAPAPDYIPRLVGIGIVILANAIIIVPTCLALFRHGGRIWLVEHSRQAIVVYSVSSITVLGAAYAVLDMLACLADSTELRVIAMTAGLVATAPLFHSRA